MSAERGPWGARTRAIGRGIRIFLFYAVIPFALAVLLLWLALPRLAEGYAQRWLDRSGPPDSSVEIRSVGLSRLELAELRLDGGTATADRVTIHYQAHRFLDRDKPAAEAIEMAEIVGLRVHARHVDGRWHVGSLWPTADKAGSAPVPVFPKLRLRDAAVLLDSEWGPVEIPLSGDMSATPDGISGHVESRIVTGMAAGTAEIALEWSPVTERLDLFATIDHGWTDMGPVRLSGISCQAAGTLAPDMSPESTGFCRIGAIDLPLTEPSADLDWRLAGGEADLSARLYEPTSAIAAQADMSVSGIGADSGGLSLSAELRSPDPSTVTRLSRGAVTLASGPASAQLTGTGRWRADGLVRQIPASLDDVDLDLTGTATLSVPSLTIADTVRGLTVDGDFAYRLSSDHVSIGGPGMAIAARSLTPALIGLSTSNALAPFVAQGARLDIAARDAPIATIHWDDPDAPQARVTTALSFEVGAPDNALAVTAIVEDAELDVSALPETVRVRSLGHAAVTAAEPPATPFDIRLSPISVTLSGADGAFKGQAEVGARGRLDLGDAMVVDSTRATLRADFDYAARTLQARLADGTILHGDGVRFDGPQPATVAPFTLAPARDRASTLEARLDEAGALQWRGRLELAPTAIEARIDPPAERPPSGGEDQTKQPITIDATMPALSVSADGVFGDGAAARPPVISLLGTGGTALARTVGELLPGHPLSAYARDIAIRADLGADAALSGSLEVGRLGFDAPRPLVVPMALTVAARTDDDAIALEAQATDGSGNIVLRFEGDHDPRQGGGAGTARLFPIRFLEDGFQPTRLFPYFADRIGTTTGSIEIAGDVSWSPSGLLSDMVLTARDLTTRFDDIDLVGVNTALTFDRLLPPSTQPGQLVAIQGFDLGLPLTDGLLSIRFDRQGAPLLESSTWQWAGGRVMTSTVRQRGSDDDVLVLEVDRIQLGALLALFPETLDIEATGSLHGRIPVVLREGEFVITEGWLESDFDGGTIRYKPNELAPGLLAGGGGVELLLDALENFRYTRMRVELIGRADELTDVSFRIRGSNPDLYGGSEFELNLNVSGRLDQIFRDNYQAYYTLPDSVARKLAAPTESPAP